MRMLSQAQHLQWFTGTVRRSHLCPCDKCNRIVNSLKLAVTGITTSQPACLRLELSHLLSYIYRHNLGPRGSLRDSALRMHSAAGLSEGPARHCGR